MKDILVLGASGAMATYLIPALLERGDKVTGVCLEDMVSHHENLTYIKGNAKTDEFMKTILAKKYDAIVDFMVYYNEDFEKWYGMLLSACDHYIYFSSYRIYAGETPLKENSPRLLDIEKSSDFVTDHEYSIYKAEQEDMLRNSPYRHYTIVRPAITYSQCRFQLVTLEADVLLTRMAAGKTVFLPEGAIDRDATMTWAGDVAKMLKAILLNEKAYGET